MIKVTFRIKRVKYFCVVNISSLAISTLFIAITLANSLKVAGTIGYYALFTENFIERFCENKDKPELQCDGKCELSKMLLQEAEDKELPINLDLLKNETVWFPRSALKIDFFEYRPKTFRNLYYTNHYRFNFIERVIHPPQF